MISSAFGRKSKERKISDIQGHAFDLALTHSLTHSLRRALLTLNPDLGSTHGLYSVAKGSCEFCTCLPEYPASPKTKNPSPMETCLVWARGSTRHSTLRSARDRVALSEGRLSYLNQGGHIVCTYKRIHKIAANPVPSY